MGADPVVLILGSGPRIGASIADKFASNGYKVAIVSRSGSGKKDSNGYLSLKADLSKPDSVPALFDAVKAEFNNIPNVVVYNAASLTPPPDQDSVLSVSVDSFASDLAVNTISPYAAAQQTVSAWEALPNDTKKTFIYTGNLLNTAILPVPLFLDLGVGKSASAFWIGLADTAYSARKLRFFYADQRQADGSSAGQELDGPAHADFYAQLASHQGNVPWHATFVKGKGYVKF